MTSYTGFGNSKDSEKNADDNKKLKTHNKDCEKETFFFGWEHNHDHGKFKGKHRHNKHKSYRSIMDAISTGDFNPFIQASLKTSKLAKEQTNITGFRLGIQNNGTNFFSLGYYKTPRNFDVKKSNAEATKGNFSYGGLEFGGLSSQGSIIEPYLRLLLGVGKLQVWNALDISKTSSVGLVFDPEIGFNINFSRYVQIGAGVSHKFVRGIDKMGLNDSDFSQWTLGTHIIVSDFRSK